MENKVKQCTSCEETKELSLFERDSRKLDGVTRRCLACAKEYKARWNLENRERQLTLKRKYYQEHKEVFALRSKCWKAQNIEKKRASNRDWNRRNKSLKNLYSFMRRKRHRQATPSWLTEQDYMKIASLYILAKNATKLWTVDHQVDHIIPLSGKFVSGLHVPWNLQVLPTDLNRVKSNKV